jgi:hypothetical protein
VETQVQLVDRVREDSKDHQELLAQWDPSDPLVTLDQLVKMVSRD